MKTILLHVPTNYCHTNTTLTLLACINSRSQHRPFSAQRASATGVYGGKPCTLATLYSWIKKWSCRGGGWRGVRSTNTMKQKSTIKLTRNGSGTHYTPCNWPAVQTLSDWDRFLPYRDSDIAVHEILCYSAADFNAVRYTAGSNQPGIQTAHWGHTVP